MTDRAPQPSTPFDLADFGLREMLRCGNDVRTAARAATCLEDVAQAVTRYLYDSARHPRDGERSCALVRCFLTRAYGVLDLELQREAERVAGGPLAVDVRCLVLLATIGDEPAWRDRRRSRGHQVIPLVSAEAVRAAPMIAQLLQSFGVPIEEFVGAGDPDRLLRATTGKTYGVFHVPDAPGSAYIPAQQEFVAPYGIRSVLGFGSALPSGDVVAVIMFSRTAIHRDAADRFRTIALDLKAILHRVGERTVFAAAPAPPGAH